MSSARTNEGWLSPEACLDGTSTGMPAILARLNGLEKLNAGRGSRVPPIETSELIDPERAIEYIPGEIGDVENALSEEKVRFGDRA